MCTEHMQFLSFAALVQDPSHPPSVVVELWTLGTVFNSDTLKPVVGQHAVAKLICNDICVNVLCYVNKGTAALCGRRHLQVGNPA